MDCLSLMVTPANISGLKLMEMMIVVHQKKYVPVITLDTQHLLLLVPIIIVNQDVVVQMIILLTTLMTHYGMGQDVSLANAVALLTNHGSIVS